MSSVWAAIDVHGHGRVCESTLSPNLEDSARLVMKLLNAARGPRLSPAVLVEARLAADALSPADHIQQQWPMSSREFEWQRLSLPRCVLHMGRPRNSLRPAGNRRPGLEAP
jgi:hypothetical protein